ncbi:MAG: cupin domain-containing protein [Candidatus Omnitrophica bacterium]|nr:cupin domain-containing protein [Candidatus Omnitrophota bacterium]
MTWSEEDRTKVLAVQTLKITPEASYHWIRLNGAEKSHIHKEHDLAVFILKGKARFYFADHKIDVKSGDVIEIPRGKIHRAEKKSKEPVEVYAVFTPPFDGKDHHELSEEK